MPMKKSTSSPTLMFGGASVRWKNRSPGLAMQRTKPKDSLTEHTRPCSLSPLTSGLKPVGWNQCYCYISPSHLALRLRKLLDIDGERELCGVIPGERAVPMLLRIPRPGHLTCPTNLTKVTSGFVGRDAVHGTRRRRRRSSHLTPARVSASVHRHHPSLRPLPPVLRPPRWHFHRPHWLHRG